MSSKTLNVTRCSTGNHCNFWRIALVRAALGNWATRRAAQFWMRCNFWNKYFGEPSSSELQLSNRQITNAWTRGFVLLTYKYSRIFLRWNKAALQREFTCFSRDNVWSKTTPMFLAETEGHTRQFPSTILSKDVGGRYLELMTINSVLSLFSLSLLQVIQLSISLTRDSTRETELAWSSAHRELKERYYGISSA